MFDSKYKSRQRKKAVTNFLLAIALLAAFGLIGYLIYNGQPGQLSDAKLIERVESEKARTRLNAAVELAKRQNPAALSPLLEALNSEEFLDRLHAIEALGQLRDRRAIPALSTFLEKQNISLVKAAADSLAEIGDQSAVDPLLRALHNQPPASRWALAGAFSKYRDESAVPDLLEAVVLDDIVRSHVDGLLKALATQGEDPIPALVDSVLNGGPGAWTLAEIEKTTGKKITAMHEVITNRDLKTLSRAYLFFIYLDQDSSNVAENDRVSIAAQEVLAEALFAYGDKEMAQTFVNFRGNVKDPPGKNILAEAGETWAEEHGYTLKIKN